MILVPPKSEYYVFIPKPPRGGLFYGGKLNSKICWAPLGYPFLHVQYFRSNQKIKILGRACCWHLQLLSKMVCNYHVPPPWRRCLAGKRAGSCPSPCQGGWVVVLPTHKLPSTTLIVPENFNQIGLFKS